MSDQRVRDPSSTRKPSFKEPNTRERSVAFLIFGFLLACYLLTYTGVIQSSDGLSMFATAESIVRRGEIDSNQLLWMGLQQGSFAPDGELYGRKGLGMVLLALPLVWFAHWWDTMGLARAALLLNPILTAWSGALLYRFGCRLGWKPIASLCTALSFGIGTLAWPYTQEFFSDPVCAWGLLATFYALYSYRQTEQKHYLLLSGVAWGLAYLARAINLVTLPIFVVALLVIVAEHAQLRLQLSNLSPLLRQQWRPLIAFAIPVLCAGLLSLLWNWLRYGNIFDSGYLESESFSADWLFGIAGLLFSPARGFFWYSPILLLSFFGIRRFWRQERPSLLVILSLSLLYLLLYGKWYMWHGGFSWGPRFLVPIIPFLSLLLGPVWQQLTELRNKFVWGGVYLLMLLSVLVQWLGMVIPFGLVQNWLAEAVTPLFAPQTFTQLHYSPLLRQWDFLRRENMIFVWWQEEHVNWFLLLMPCAAVLVGIFLLVQEFRDRWAARPTIALRNWVYGASLVAISLVLLTYRPITAQEREVELLTQQIQTQGARGDAILNLRPDETQMLADRYSGSLPVYGLMASSQLDTENQRWLEHLRQRYDRLWLMPDATPPELSGWERALRMNDFFVKESRPENTSDRRLVLYAIAQNEQLTESGLGILFGDPVRAKSAITDQNGWIRLRSYALTAEVMQGGAVLIELRWESLQKIGYDYQVFVHLLDAKGEKLSQRDGQPVQWMRPTSTWQVGETILDHYALPLPDDLPTGDYTVAVGLYDPVSGQRLPISAGPEDYTIELGPVRVVER